MRGLRWQSRLAAAAGILLFTAAIVVADVACGTDSAGPNEGKIITVVLRNAGTLPVHILAPNEQPNPADPPTGNRLQPGSTRDWTSTQPYKAGNAIAFRAIRNGEEIAGKSCTLTNADINGNPRLEVRFTESGGGLLTCS